jgi:putative transposase
MMDLEPDYLYHIYNQGNNKQKIFFNTNNYLFFLNKVRTYILPYADIVAYCLMPNHFHLMVYVNHIEIHPMTSGSATNLDNALVSRAPTINKSIGILLASYTRAINNQQKTSGSLFRAKTKSECLTKTYGVTPSFYNTESGAKINVPLSEKEYPQICFNYIHNNPLKAGLVENPEDWEFSSYRDYCDLRKGTLINKSMAIEFNLKW